MDWEKYDTVIGKISLISGILFGIAFVLSLFQPLDMKQILGIVFFLALSVFLISIYRKSKEQALSMWQRLPAILLTIGLIIWIVVSAIVLFLLLSGKIY